jgi:hypothetical protein
MTETLQTVAAVLLSVLFIALAGWRDAVLISLALFGFFTLVFALFSGWVAPAVAIAGVLGARWVVARRHARRTATTTSP